MALHRDLIEEESEPELNISPLVDCAFLLLVYFLVSTSLVKEEADLSLVLPGISSTKTVSVPIDQMMIRIDNSGAVSVNKETLDTNVSDRELPNLTDRLRRYTAAAMVAGTEPQVIISCDGDVPEQRFVDVLNACAKTKVKNVSLAQ